MSREEEQVSERGWPYGLSGLERSIGNGRTRVLIAVIAIPLLLLIFVEGGWWLSVLAFGLAFGASLELYWMTKGESFHPYLYPLLFGVTAIHGIESIAINSTLLGENAMHLLTVALILVLLITLIVALRDEHRTGLGRTAGTFFAWLYGGLLIGSLPLLYHDVPNYLSRTGSFVESSEAFHFIAVAFVSIWLCDTGAYLVGRSVGKRKLAPAISPNKSVEGALGGLLFSIIGAIGLGTYLIEGADLLDVLAIGLIAGTLGQIGDLVESHIKRACGVKDSSAIIPGHGGILDRFDSLLLVSPALLAYVYLRPIVESLFR